MGGYPGPLFTSKSIFSECFSEADSAVFDTIEKLLVSTLKLFFYEFNFSFFEMYGKEHMCLICKSFQLLLDALLACF